MRYLFYIAIGALAGSCISPIEFEVEKPSKQLIIEGRITDGEPPYVVQVSNSLDLSADTLINQPEEGATVYLYEYMGNSELLVETMPGRYESSGVIQGRIGKAYFIRVETVEGSIFFSSPDSLKAVGEIQDIRFEYEKRTTLVPFGEVASDVFNIFIDATGGVEQNPNIRWGMTGIYRVITYPALRMTEVVPYEPVKDPVPCSGYIVTEGPIGSGGLLEQVSPCTCCDCWGYHYTSIPQLSSEFFVEDGSYQNILVGEVPITNYTFHDKYLVQIEQMSLSDQALAFYESVRQQKLSSGDLFQPQLGTLMSNVEARRSTDEVVGIFYATSVNQKSLYLTRDAVPYEVTPIAYKTEACYDSYENATNVRPEFWID